MLEKELARLEEELKVLPYGSLRCTSSRGTDQFYVMVIISVKTNA